MMHQYTSAHHTKMFKNWKGYSLQTACFTSRGVAVGL